MTDRRDRSPILRARLAMILRKKGVSARALSIHAGQSESYVKRVLAGKILNPGSETVARLERSLGVPIGFLTASKEDVVRTNILKNAIEAEALRAAAKAEKNLAEKERLLHDAALADESYFDFTNEWLKPYIGKTGWALSQAVQRLSVKELYPPDDRFDYLDPPKTRAEHVMTPSETFDHAALAPIENSLPLVGYVGAGAMIYPINDYASGPQDDSVEAPFSTPKDSVAVTVKGDSMFPEMDDGDTLVYQQGGPFLLENCINRRCIIHTEEGQILVKRLKHARIDGLFDLHSLNAPTMENVEVIWAAPVLGIIYR